MKAIIFDFGEIIALHKGLFYVPIYPDTEKWHQAEGGIIPEEEFWQELERYYHKAAEQIIQELFEEREANVPLIDFLKGKKAELKFAFINNGLSRLAEKIIKEWNLEDIFSVMIISAKEKIAKPDPKIFLLACERLGVFPQDCIFVGRKEGYVEAAKSLGMKGFVYKDIEDFKTQISGLLA